jgi:hypothetical protein
MRTERLTHPDSMFSLPAFEHQLVMYVTSDDKEVFNAPFDISKIPIVTREQADAEDRTKKLTATAPTLKAPKPGPRSMLSAQYSSRRLLLNLLRPRLSTLSPW